MIKAPSLQRPFTLIWTEDPALVGPESQEPEAIKAYADKLRVCRETGDWSSAVKPGQVPTLFHCRRLSGKFLRAIGADINRKALGQSEFLALVVRDGLVSVDNFGDYTFRREDHDRYGSLAPEELVDRLDAAALELYRPFSITNELVSLIFDISQEGVSPKS